MQLLISRQPGRFVLKGPNKTDSERVSGAERAVPGLQGRADGGEINRSDCLGRSGLRVRQTFRAVLLAEAEHFQARVQRLRGPTPQASRLVELLRRHKGDNDLPLSSQIFPDRL